MVFSQADSAGYSKEGVPGIDFDLCQVVVGSLWETAASPFVRGACLRDDYLYIPAHEASGFWS